MHSLNSAAVENPKRDEAKERALGPRGSIGGQDASFSCLGTDPA